jgi:hypothetical protein
MKTCVNFFAVVLLLIQLSVVTTAQQTPVVRNPTPESSGEWKGYLSLRGRFSVLLPDAPVNSVVTTKSAAGPIVMFRSITHSLAQYAIIFSDHPRELIEKRSVDEIFEIATWSGGGSQNSKVLSNSSTSVDGNPARLRREVLPDGVLIQMKTILVAERLYIVIIASQAGTATDADATRVYDKNASKFLDSFRLLTPGARDGKFKEIERTAMILYEACLPLDLNCPPLTVPVFNGRAIKLPKPEMPAAARSAHAEGAVEVEVIVDEKGDVIDTHAVNGHPLLVAVSLEAARKAKFTPTLIGNKPVKVIAVVIYHFEDR